MGRWEPRINDRKNLLESLIAFMSPSLPLFTTNNPNLPSSSTPAFFFLERLLQFLWPPDAPTCPHPFCATSRAPTHHMVSVFTWRCNRWNLISCHNFAFERGRTTCSVSTLCPHWAKLWYFVQVLLEPIFSRNLS